MPFVISVGFNDPDREWPGLAAAVIQGRVASVQARGQVALWL
jgi:hypothetical protein